MQSVWLLPVAVAFAIVTIIVLHAPESRPQKSPPVVHSGQTVLSSIERWEDSISGISLAYPAGWAPMQLPDLDSRSELLEPGFAIGFESPRTAAGDSFADYLLVEILPGTESGHFTTDGSRRLPADIDGRIAWRDSLLLEQHPIGDATIDLAIQQAGFEGLGYNVGLYVIGERSESPYLDEVFEVLLRTFNLDGEPFRVI